MSNQPHFRLVVSPKYDKNAEKSPGTRIGAAWKIEKDGGVIGLNIKLDRGMPPMLLSSDFDLTLWKNDERGQGGGGGGGNYGGDRKPATPPADDFGDDDIPF